MLTIPASALVSDEIVHAEYPRVGQGRLLAIVSLLAFEHHLMGSFLNFRLSQAGGVISAQLILLASGTALIAVPSRALMALGILCELVGMFLATIFAEGDDVDAERSFGTFLRASGFPLIFIFLGFVLSASGIIVETAGKSPGMAVMLGCSFVVSTCLCIGLLLIVLKSRVRVVERQAVV